MADLQTLDSPTDDLSHSHSTSSSDPSLLRSLSLSKLNAKAPEFVPNRTTPPPRPMIIPPPPPHGMLRMYHHQPPFNLPPHRFPPHHRNQHNRYQNQQYVPVRNHHEEPDLVAKKRPEQKSETGAGSAMIDLKTGLTEDTIQKIVKQVEYYFSDLNLATTDHLLRFISKDPEGYVPIHVVSSFKKVKAVINSNSQLALVLQKSTKLVVSEDENKVRRVNPITESAVEELQSRIIIAENLPEDHCYQNLMKIFSTVGSVKNIRTCQPQVSGNGAPPATARSAKNDASLLSSKLHAFVEYEFVELAEKAVTELNEAGKWNGLKVRLMLKHQAKERRQGQGRGRKGNDEEDDATTSEHQPIEKQSEECYGEWGTHVQEQTVVGGEEQGNEKATGQRKGRSRGRGKGRGRGQQPQQNNNQNQNHNNNGRGNHHHHNQHHHHVGTPPSNNQMNHMEQQQQPGVGKQQPPGPRMPDGSRGFSMGRGKPVMVKAE